MWKDWSSNLVELAVEARRDPSEALWLAAVDASGSQFVGPADQSGQQVLEFVPWRVHATPSYLGATEGALDGGGFLGGEAVEIVDQPVESPAPTPPCPPPRPVSFAARMRSTRSTNRPLSAPLPRGPGAFVHPQVISAHGLLVLSRAERHRLRGLAIRKGSQLTADVRGSTSRSRTRMWSVMVRRSNVPRSHPSRKPRRSISR